MELRVLRYFLAVAREETITKASEILHVSQPTLSRQLSEMEEDLGKKLFIRGNRKITLTENGQFLRKRAQEIIELVDKTESELSKEPNIIRGDIFIGGGETKAMQLLAKVAYEVQQRHPDIRYHLYSGNADDVSDKLEKGLLDFGVFIEPADITKYDFLPIPEKDVWGVLMHKDSPLANKNSIQPSDLLELPLIVSRQTFVDDVLSVWLGTNMDHVNIAATYNLIYNASLLVREKMGYAIALDQLIHLSPDDELCFVPLSPRLEANLNVVWKKHQVFSKAASTFLKQLQAVFDQ